MAPWYFPGLQRIQLGGSGITLDPKDRAEFIHSSGATMISSHDNCAAAAHQAVLEGILPRRGESFQQMVNRFAREFAQATAREFGLQYFGHIHSEAQIRNSWDIYYVGQDFFNPDAHNLEPRFQVSRTHHRRSKNALDEVRLVVKKAGESGVTFNEEKPFRCTVIPGFNGSGLTDEELIEELRSDFCRNTWFRIDTLQPHQLMTLI